MAYRFLLQVPELRVDEANIAVGSAEDAQVLVVRNSHGLGFDDPYSDLTIAAHSLGVIGAIYEWYSSLEDPKPEVGLVLHSGERVPLTAATPRQMVAAIRRDQPWAEHTLPKIGEHMRDVLPGAGSVVSGLSRTERFLEAYEPTPVLVPRKKLNLLNPVQVAVEVTELDRAEKYYVDFLGMTLWGREREDDLRVLRPVEEGYNHTASLSLGTEADVSYLSNGTVSMALIRVGRGARLGRDSAGAILIHVDRATYLQLKGDALMRGMEIVGDHPDTLLVRDIYGLVWQFTVAANVAALT